MITDEQIKQGLDKAYKAAGHNAYFGNGFQAGVNFAIEQLKNCSIPDVGSSLPKVCKGCGTLSTKVIDKKYLACCPDNNYIPMEEYCKKAIYPDKQF